MTSNLVKCASCNVVINEVLAFVSNKIDVMKEDGITQICTSAFSDLEIKMAKDLLFESLPASRRKKIRKGTGKARRDIDDIVTLMKEVNPELCPIFVARDLHRLPPVYFDHVDTTRLLKDILILQQDVKKINDQFATKEQLDTLALDLNALKNTSLVNGSEFTKVNTKRGAFLDSYEYNSGPMGLLHMSENSETAESIKSTGYNENIYRSIVQAQNSSDECNYNSNINCKNASIEIEEKNVNKSVVGKDSQKNAAITHSLPNESSPPATSNTAPPLNDALARKHTAAASVGGMKQKSLADIVREGEWKPPIQSDEWILCQKQKSRNRFVGNRGNAVVGDEFFKAADTKIPIYIYNVSKEVPVCEINKYIQRKTSLSVTIEKMNMKRAKDYDAYKIFVPKHKLNIFMTDEFWPDGVAYRRFFDFKYKKPLTDVEVKKTNCESNKS